MIVVDRIAKMKAVVCKKITAFLKSKGKKTTDSEPLFSISQVKRFLSRNKFYKLSYFCIWVGIITGLYFFIYWQVENDIRSDEARLIAEAVAADEENASPDIIDTSGNKINPYWSYIDADILSANFTNLKAINPQTVAWLKVNNTNINYPVVQAEDNDYYLHHSFNGSKNSHGWVFMDYENNPNFDNLNTIIYAHERHEGDMFGTLKQTLNNEWQSNRENHIIKTISSESQIMFWEIFSTYTIATTNDYIQTDFYSDEQFGDFLNMIQLRSSLDYGVEVSNKDKILTLSTCYGLLERMVVHAKLVYQSN